MAALIRTDGFGKVHRPCFLNLAENRVGSARMSQVFIEENGITRASRKPGTGAVSGQAGALEKPEGF